MNYVQPTLTLVLFSALRSWPRIDSATGEWGALCPPHPEGVSLGLLDCSCHPLLSFPIKPCRSARNDTRSSGSFPLVTARVPPGPHLAGALKLVGLLPVSCVTCDGTQVPQGPSPFMRNMGGSLPKDQYCGYSLVFVQQNCS